MTHRPRAGRTLPGSGHRLTDGYFGPWPRSPTTCRAMMAKGGREADSFYRDRWSRQGGAVDARGELHRAPARGRCTSRTGSSPGRRSRPTTRRSGRTGPSTSRAAARAARRSPGTPTPPPGCATRTCAACCWRCSARPRPATAATRCPRGREIVDDPERARLQVTPAARAGSSGPTLGRGDRDRRGRPGAHHQDVGPGPGRRLLADPGDVHGQPRRRRPVPLACSARRCCRSTTGTPTCRSPRRRCSATRPTCRSPPTGGTPPT